MIWKLLEGRDVLPKYLLNGAPKHGLHQLFSEFLPKAKSWHENLQIWGDTESTDIQAWYEKGQLSAY